MRAALPFLLAAVLGVGSGVLAACGGSGDRSALIPQSSASRMDNALDDVRSAVDDGDCTGAQQALARARGVLVNLPNTVDSQLRDRLRQGLDNLRTIVPQQCQQSTSTETTPPETTTTNTTPTNTTPPDTTPTDTTPTDTTPTNTTPTTTTGTTTTTPPTTTTTAPPADTTGGVDPP